MTVDPALHMNHRIPETPPVIAPLSPDASRPLWSVMIPAFNCSAYLIDTIRSVLAQDPGTARMQIRVVDDFSTDTNVEELVRYIGGDRVEYYRQPRNVGSLRNFETCLNQARGEFIHLLHGDDLVKPGFYEEVEKTFARFPEAGAVFTGFEHINEDDEPLYFNKKFTYEPAILNNFLLEIAHMQVIQPPAMVVKRTVYEDLGGFFGVHYGEDWEMWARIAAKYPIAHSPLRLARYRMHQNNITSRSFLSGQSFRDIEKVIDRIQLYLPEGKRRRMKGKAVRHFANYFAKNSDNIYHHYHRPDVALAHARHALDFDVNLITVYHFLKIHLKSALRYKFPREMANGSPSARTA